ATMTVRNDGQATAAMVLPAPQPPMLTATGLADATTSSVPMAQSIVGGGTATFTWTFMETGSGTGTLRLSGGAQGLDANTGLAVSAAAVNSNVSTVQLPPSLSI